MFKVTASWKVDCGNSHRPFVSGDLEVLALAGGEGERTERLKPAIPPPDIYGTGILLTITVVTALNPASSLLTRTPAPAPIGLLLQAPCLESTLPCCRELRITPLLNDAYSLSGPR